LVHLVASGICQTDIDLCNNWDSADSPVVLGHEGAGLVEQILKSVKGAKRGDHVVLSYKSCGRCRPCGSGRSTGCERFWEANFGFARLEVSNAMQRSGVRWHFFGQSSFATHVIDNCHDDIASRIIDITGSGIDYVVETTGNWKMHRLANDVLNPHGPVALLTGAGGTDGLPEGHRTVGIIQGDAIPQRFIPKLIALYRAGQFPFDRLVKFYDFTEINEAIADAKRGDIIKPVLRINEV
jgi:Zn-dependent alcohol dehydrogenase